MPKCMLLKHGMTIGPSGAVRPCCAIKNDKMTWRYHEDGWRDYFDDLYAKSQSDEWLPDCHECQSEEKIYGYSMRTEANRQIPENSIGLQYWDLKINNTCNLMCRMCTPISSSTWKKNVKESGHDKWGLKSVLEEVDIKTGWHKETLPLILENLYDTKVLKFTGGEPFLIPHVEKIIDWCIAEDIAPAIELRITTNGTIPIDISWEAKFKHFKQVEILISVDGIGDRYDYVRSGGKWSEVEQNILNIKEMSKRHHAMATTILFLPMSINIVVADELEAWCSEHEINFHKTPECYRPYWLSYESVNDRIREKYNIQTTTPYKPESFEALKEQMKLIDEIYNVDFESACPEFFENE